MSARVEPGLEIEQRPAVAGATRLFRICTLVSNWEQYSQMTRSFIAAGFDASRCVYSPFDNASGNRFEPYSLINALIAELAEPYLIVCHQDVLLDRGHGFHELKERLAELDRHDPNWAIAGNAGCTDDFEFAVRVRDPNNFVQWPGPFPAHVHSLDENFLILRRGARVGCSTELSGFHLYGTDLCLNARLNGHTCHVIDFEMTHLSAGVFGNDFFASRQRFIERWNRQFHFVYVIREADIFLSRWRLFHRVFGRVRPRRWLRRFGPSRRLMTWELHLGRHAAGA